MATNKKITDLTVSSAPSGGAVYIVKAGVDYQVPIGGNNGLAFLDATGLIPAANLPGGDGDKGDITISGSGTVYAIDNDVVTNAKLANMATATIKGRNSAGTGDPEDLTATQAKAVLALTKGDVGLGNVDNTSDANKPVSTATQTALNGKANTSHTHVIGDVTGLQAALDGKQAVGSYAAAVHTHVATDISNSTTTGRSVMTAIDADAARDAIGIFVQASDPGAVADGTVWLW